MKERDFIAFALSSLARKSANVAAAIGDDCAVIKYTPGKYLLVTTDALYEGVHFSKKYFTPAEIGMRAAAANISDICAMGGLPLYAVASIGFPAKEKQTFLRPLYRGFIKYLERYGARLVGGDTIRADRVFISVTLIGEVEKKRLLTRRGAKPGNRIFVTGILGDSKAGLTVLKSKTRAQITASEFLPVKRHLVPSPKLAEGRLLSASGMVSSCIDLSDGAASDIERVCEQSGTGAVIDASMLPLSYSAMMIAKKAGQDASDYALYGGEDYELMFTVPEAKISRFKEYAAARGMTAFEIGRIIKGRGVHVIKGGRKKKIERKKIWDHFK
jgi:thiamine-monophosphate kinase